MSAFIDQAHPLYLEGQRKANEDLDSRSPDSSVAWWVQCAERIQAVAQQQGAADLEHEIAGYLHTLRDHLAEQAT